MNKTHILNGDGTPLSSKSETAKSHQSSISNIQPTFPLNGLYSDESGLLASRWLKKLQYNLKPYYQSGFLSYTLEFINKVDAPLTVQAAKWAKNNPLMQVKINKQSLINNDVEAIKPLLQDKFPQGSSEVHIFDTNAAIEDLCQQPEKTLSVHYKRVQSIIERVGPETSQILEFRLSH